MKRKISFIMVIVMMLSFASGVFADGISNQEVVMITLENGQNVTEREFIEILEAYEGEVYKVSSETNFLDDYTKESVGNIGTRSMAMPMDDVMKIMAGTWYIPGIGKVVVTVGAIYVGGIVLTKVSSSIASKVKDWLKNRAINKQIDKAISELGGVNSNKANHILQSKHNWSSLVPGGPKDPNRWNKIKKIIEKVMKEGSESAYGSAYKKTLRYKGEVVEVTYQKLKDGVIKISNAWVK
ncbi:polymorphic toxin type 35 domain-containing protein [Tissierella pigra]|uniref:Bacterial toxin 35 domain-containing protein n=1 Tax=Tissierella pigra TaxID=2607614 RepID=A0A6N7XX96_9FIRM|nr:polymorphic toxin type 35 domain-containing protein [Tissierella pigra]MSU01115.1 hypothetical protein [Tissierella pigra]